MAKKKIKVNEEVQTDKAVLVENPKNAYEEKVSKIPLTDIYEKFINAEQTEVTVKELTIVTRHNFLESVKNLKKLFETELQKKTRELSAAYEAEVDKIKRSSKMENVPQLLGDVIREVMSLGWNFQFVSQSESGLSDRVMLVKRFEPMLEIKQGMKSNGELYKYEKTVCSIKAIYFNFTDLSINDRSIALDTRGRHPNASGSEQFSFTCVGNLKNEKIMLTNPVMFVNLLNRIENTYKYVHMDSTYYTPGSKTTLISKQRDDIWTA